MGKKPPMKYSQNAYRSRLFVPSIIMPYKNAHQIIIGYRMLFKLEIDFQNIILVLIKIPIILMIYIMQFPIQEF